MLLSAVSVLVVAQSSSEIPEGLMNNPVFSRLETLRVFSVLAVLLTLHSLVLHNLLNIIALPSLLLAVRLPCMDLGHLNPKS